MQTLLTSCLENSYLHEYNFMIMTFHSSYPFTHTPTLFQYSSDVLTHPYTYTSQCQWGLHTYVSLISKTKLSGGWNGNDHDDCRYNDHDDSRYFWCDMRYRTTPHQFNKNFIILLCWSTQHFGLFYTETDTERDCARHDCVHTSVVFNVSFFPVTEALSGHWTETVLMYGIVMSEWGFNKIKSGIQKFYEVHVLLSICNR